MLDRILRCVILALIGLSPLHASRLPAQPRDPAPVLSDSAMQALYLYNFAKFIDWPDKTFFDKRTPLFILIHLNDGKMVGGYFGDDSYATSYPCEGDIYIQTVYKVDEDGRFGETISGSRGLLIRKDQYTYIETFDVPN